MGRQIVGRRRGNKVERKKRRWIKGSKGMGREAGFRL
jgi:hypothetical protein